MVIDFVVISAAGLSFHSIESALYGYGTLFLSTKVIDFVLEGWSYARPVRHHRAAGCRGRRYHRRPGPRRHAPPRTGRLHRKQLDVIYCVVTKREVQFIKRYPGH